MVREGPRWDEIRRRTYAVHQPVKASESTAFYKAAIIYNTGAIAQSGNLEDGGATHCYASDIANRLTC
jgi:hypothetical protein